MKYAYFPGCTLESTSREYDISMRAVFKALNIELVEIPDWICCGSTPAHNTNHKLSLALPIQSLVWPEKEGLDVVAPCASCFSRLKLSNTQVQNNPGLQKEINGLIDGDYNGGVKVFNILEVLEQDAVMGAIRNNIKKKLSGLKVACYYGCLLSRPREIEAGSIENPVLMDEICELIGAEPVQWPYKTECCGAGFSLSKTEVVLKLTNDILKMAKSAGANCIAVACPLCQSNLDLRQRGIEKEYKVKYNMPVMYITQMLGLSMGIPPKELAMDKLIVDPVGMLNGKNLIGA